MMAMIQCSDCGFTHVDPPCLATPAIVHLDDGSTVRESYDTGRRCEADIPDGRYSVRLGEPARWVVSVEWNE